MLTLINNRTNIHILPKSALPAQFNTDILKFLRGFRNLHAHHIAITHQTINMLLQTEYEDIVLLRIVIPPNPFKYPRSVIKCMRQNTDIRLCRRHIPALEIRRLARIHRCHLKYCLQTPHGPLL